MGYFYFINHTAPHHPHVYNADSNSTYSERIAGAKQNQLSTFLVGLYAPLWGHVAMSGYSLGCHKWGGACYWNFMSRDQGSGSTSINVQDSLPNSI